jgi:hypothetical protein
VGRAPGERGEGDTLRAEWGGSLPEARNPAEKVVVEAESKLVLGMEREQVLGAVAKLREER